YLTPTDKRTPRTPQSVIIQLALLTLLHFNLEKPETRNPKPETRNPKPETRNPKPETRNPQNFIYKWHQLIPTIVLEFCFYQHRE
ncbi:hypothetical protein, partial [Pseudoalteromonas prydzensis]|uniref:hypothetical protein n=1 Tax=Pseudoalteromonas prydzensis TaxID=182141 RepID=UPI001CE4A686